MSRKALLNLALVILIIAGIAAAVGLILYYDNLPERLSQHETIVVGQNRFVPGSQGALRVLVRDSKDGAPLENAEVQVALRPKDGGKTVPLYSGATGSGGTADITFRVPADASPESTLTIETHSSLGEDKVERPVTIERDYRVLLTTDKPIYQPGQVIHVRALALSTFDLVPAAGQPLEVTIADGKGNKVFRQTLTTSSYGVAFTDFQLADEVNTGPYKITASQGNTSSEKTVTVEHYVLPKFEVELATDQPFYQPGQHVTGSLNARYFFGKPVSEGQVKLEGFTFDVQRNDVFALEGTTDAEGNFTFEFDLPAYLTGSDLEGGLGRFYVAASVIDGAQHTETSNLSLPVASNNITIQAVPEGGSFRMGLENILYVMTSTPDGNPVQASLNIQFPNTGKTLEAQTSEYGLAEVTFIPDSPYQYLIIQAQDAQGNRAQREFQFEGEWNEQSVLLRPERPVYQVGETMKLTLLSTLTQGTAYLDIVREGQTISTRAVEMQNGRGEAAVDLSADMYGTLELHAYKILPSGSIVRDTRLVVVSQANDLNVSLSAAQAIYKPGETAQLNLQVNGQGGEGVPSAVGLAIVDESVFALAETDPGFAKLYFLLEKEILTPRYDLHGYSVPDLMRGLPGGDPELYSAVNGAAQASLAEAVKQTNGMGGQTFSLNANSHDDAMQRARDRQEAFFSSLSKVTFGVYLLISLAIAGISLYVLLRERTLGRSILLAIAMLAMLLLIFVLLPSPPGYDYRGAGVIDRVESWFMWLEYQGEWVVFAILLLWLASLLTLIVTAIVRKDLLLGWTMGLIVLFVVVMAAFVYTSQYSDVIESEIAGILTIIAFIAIPVMMMMRSGGYILMKRYLRGLALLPVSFLILFVVMGLGTITMGMHTTNGVMLDGAVERELMAFPAAAPQMMAGGMKAVEAQEAAPAGLDQSAVTGQAGEPPRLRQYFPETMLWLPDAVTDDSGSLVLDVPVADSITTWRMTALASSQDGRLGSIDAPLVVFQDFFIDLDLPLSLTVGDEIAIPVGIYNYLTEPQTVKLELEQAEWFELQGEPTQELTIAANEISVAYFRIRATQFGMQPFKVTAWGSKMSDAIQKEVRVYPDGKEIRFSQSDRLVAGQPVQQTTNIPAEAIAGTQKLTVKVYPGVLSQVVEGLDSILRMPFGCFEQTSSATYPNALVMDYLKTTSQTAPEAQMKAEEYINLGYQRLVTFEVGSTGGFSLFGEAPADRMLTAYGLQEFADMSRVHNVDPDLVQRAAEWLLSQQDSDGSWENDRGLVHENTWSSLGNDRLPVTAYIVWSLADAGFAGDAATQKGLEYVREFQGQAEDPYVVAMVANALVAADLKSEKHEISSTTAAVLDRLAAMAQREGESAFWQSSVATFMGGEGQTGSIETTAMAALALLRAESHPEVANAALVYLVRQKDSFGTWHSTQATVLTLKALLQSVRGSEEGTNATVTITLNGGQEKTLNITPENFDVVQMVSFADVNIGRENTVEIRAEGKGSLMYQVTGSYYLPWDQLVKYPELVPQSDAVRIDVAYDRAELAVNDSVTETVTVTLTEPGAKAEQAMIDLGIPPGFSVQTEDLEALVARYQDTLPDDPSPKINRYELTGRQILLYVTNLSEGQPLAFSFRLQARFPLNVQSPASNAYDYYNPSVSGEIPPQRIVVNP